MGSTRISLGMYDIVRDTYVRKVRGPTHGWKSVAFVKHEHHVFIRRKVFLSITQPIVDKTYRIVTTVVQFKNGVEHIRHSIFTGELEPVLELATRLALKEYAHRRMAVAA